MFSDIVFLCRVRARDLHEVCREDLLGVVEADQRVFLVRPGCGSFRIPRDKPPPLPAHEVPTAGDQDGRSEETCVASNV